MALQPRQSLQSGRLSPTIRPTNKGYYRAPRVSGQQTQNVARSIQNIGQSFGRYAAAEEGRLGREDTARAINESIGATEEQIIARSTNAAESEKYRQANQQIYLSRQFDQLKAGMAEEQIRLRSEDLNPAQIQQKLDAYASNYIKTNEYFQGMDQTVLAETFTQPLLAFSTQQADKYVEWSITENRSKAYDGAKANMTSNLDLAVSQAPTVEAGLTQATQVAQTVMDQLTQLDYTNEEVNSAVADTLISYAEANQNVEILSVLENVKAGSQSLANRPAIQSRIEAAEQRINQRIQQEDAANLKKEKDNIDTQVNNIFTDLVTSLEEDGGADVNQYAIKLAALDAPQSQINAVYSIARNIRGETARLSSEDQGTTYVNLYQRAMTGTLTTEQISFNLDNGLLTNDQAVSLINAKSNPRAIKAAQSDIRLSPIFTQLETINRNIEQFQGNSQPARAFQAKLYGEIQKAVSEEGGLSDDAAKRINTWADRELQRLDVFGGLPEELAPQEAIDELLADPSPEAQAEFEQVFGYLPEGLGESNG